MHAPCPSRTASVRVAGQRSQADLDGGPVVASDDSSIHPLALDELGPALATSTFQTLLLAVNSTSPPVVGWLSGSCSDSGTRLQHVWADDAAPEWFYYDAEAAHTCSVQRALLDVFRLLLWRSHLEGLLAESSCLVFRPSEADAPPFEHLAEAPLMLATGTRA
jgi:hypothetical protein